MTDKELLSCAVEFDAGPPPVVNGRLWSPDFADHDFRRVRIVQRYNAETKLVKWAIHDGICDLSRTGNWEWSGSHSQRKGRIRRCRYDSVYEAFDHYLRWKAAVLKWANRKVARAKPGERVVLNLPRRLKF